MEAAKIMLDTNLEQRHNLLYSEKAYAYRMRMELEGCQGKRTDLAEDGAKVDRLAEVGRKNKDNRRTVADLIRLTYLLPGLLKLVDEGTIGSQSGRSAELFACICAKSSVGYHHPDHSV